MWSTITLSLLVLALSTTQGQRYSLFRRPESKPKSEPTTTYLPLNYGVQNYLEDSESGAKIKKTPKLLTMIETRDGGFEFSGDGINCEYFPESARRRSHELLCNSKTCTPSRGSYFLCPHTSKAEWKCYVGVATKKAECGQEPKEILRAPERDCPEGTRRTHTGTCRPIFD